jgi:hypothetical protein
MKPTPGLEHVAEVLHDLDQCLTRLADHAQHGLALAEGTPIEPLTRHHLQTTYRVAINAVAKVRALTSSHREFGLRG